MRPLIVLLSLSLTGCHFVGDWDDSFSTSVWPIFRNAPNSLSTPENIMPDEPINWAAGTPFLAYVTHAALENNMPIEIALMPYLLSYYNNEAQSTPAHRGLWQIRIDQCRQYDLICQNDYDERLHPMRATSAVLKRVQALYEQHGSWDQALKDYYQEQRLYSQHALPALGNFMRALSILKARINLPEETASLPYISTEVYFEEWPVPSGTNVIEVAHSSSIDTELWQQLNGFFLNHTASEKHHIILIPSSAHNAIKIPQTSHLLPTFENINRTKHLLLYSSSRVRIRPSQSTVLAYDLLP